MKNDDVMYSLTMILICILVILFTPLLGFAIGAVMGWVIKLTMGNLVATGFGYLGITFPVAKLPIICGSLATLGSVFHLNVKKMVKQPENKFD